MAGSILEKDREARGWAGKELGRLGRVGREEKKERPVGLGCAGGKGERGKRNREWARPKEREREKKKCI
jgi:hypothetical protein